MPPQPHHRRAAALGAALAAVEAARDGRLPLDAPGVRETFTDELDLLGALTLRWHTRLTGSLEREQQRTPRDLPGATERAWARAADEMPGLRAVIDRYREHPRDVAMARAVARSAAKEHALLAASAGWAAVDDPRAVAVGERLERSARERRRADLTVLAGRAAGGRARPALAAHRRRSGLFGRLRSLVAA